MLSESVPWCIGMVRNWLQWLRFSSDRPRSSEPSKIAKRFGLLGLVAVFNDWALGVLI